MPRFNFAAAPALCVHLAANRHTAVHALSPCANIGKHEVVQMNDPK